MIIYIQLTKSTENSSECLLRDFFHKPIEEKGGSGVINSLSIYFIDF